MAAAARSLALDLGNAGGDRASPAGAAWKAQSAPLSFFSES